MAVTLVGRRANNAVSQGLCPFRDLGVANDGECPCDEQAARIAITCFLMLPSLSLPPLECCFGSSPIQVEKLRGVSKICDQSSIGSTLGM